MSNALRMFIRESLISEAVGQKTWIRNADKFGSRPAAPPQSNFLTDMYNKYFPTSTVRSAWSALTKRKTKSGLAASSKSTSRVSGRGGAWAAVALGSVLTYFLASNSSEADADKKLSDLFDALEELRISNAPKIQIGYQTPAVLEMNDSPDVDALIAAMSENYTKKTNAILSTRKLDDFFNNSDLTNSYRNMRTGIEGLITDNAGADGRASLSEFVFSYLLEDSPSEISSALFADSELIQGKRGDLSEAQQQKISEIMQTISKIQSDPEYKQSFELISSITAP